MVRGRRFALCAAAGLVATPAARAQWQWWLRGPRDWAEVDDELATRFPDVKTIDAAALTGLLDAIPAPIVLDARSRPEWTVSRIPRARAAFDDAMADAALSGVDARTPVVAYCSIGLRSAKLARRLAQAGRPGVLNLRHGVFGWAEAGGPLVDDRGPVRRVHPYDASWGRLLSAPLRAPLELR